MSKEASVAETTEIKGVCVICVHTKDRALPLERRRTLLVLDPSRYNPMLKFPGGTPHHNEVLKETAARELREETGVDVPWWKMKNIYTQERKNHHVRYYFCEANLDTADSIGNEDGVEIRVTAEYVLRQIIEGEIEVVPAHVKAAAVLLQYMIEA